MKTKLLKTWKTKKMAAHSTWISQWKNVCVQSKHKTVQNSKKNIFAFKLEKSSMAVLKPKRNSRYENLKSMRLPIKIVMQMQFSDHNFPFVFAFFRHATVFFSFSPIRSLFDLYFIACMNLYVFPSHKNGFSIAADNISYTHPVERRNCHCFA